MRDVCARGELRADGIEEGRAGVAGGGGAPEHGDVFKVGDVFVSGCGFVLVVVVPCEVGAWVFVPYGVVFWVVFRGNEAEAALGGGICRNESEQHCRCSPSRESHGEGKL